MLWYKHLGSVQRNTIFMSGFRDYYRLSHVDPDAPVKIIRSSYRTLMQ